MTFDGAAFTKTPEWGLVVPNFGPLSDTRVLADLASLAENAGWNGFFLTDTIQMEGTEASPASDPWIDLAAIALGTERIRLGLMVTAVTRYRPWPLARLAATVDHLANGRLILGVGSGDPHDRAFAAFGEEMDPTRRGAMLDESLAILDGLWSGTPFRHDGAHYTVDEIALLPTPVQQPRIPIWVGWTWPNRRPMVRAARWDGAVPFAIAPDGSYADLTANDIRELKRFVGQRREPGAPFDIVSYGPALAASVDDDALATLRATARAGATWIVDFVPPDTDLSTLREALRRGVPSLAPELAAS